ncbi:uncharacterized protein LOC121369947 [Gigantopelta aegis]|uniref:uncharacterized protein LOC121369947 n=1 Tax=Gigantopelta aegis TaxID=1735272 RepID=UPI001B88911F|nr:uncharacterized protein LOC121369947 [Gigantopelta aegis]
MATRGSVSPNSVRYHRRLDRFPEKHTDKLNLTDRQTLFEIRSVVEKKLMQMNELKDKLEDSEKCLEEERERRRRAEEHLQLVDLYHNPAINAELRERLPRASKVDPLCGVSNSGIQDSTGRLNIDGDHHLALGDDRMMQEDAECILPVADGHLTHAGNGEMQGDAGNHWTRNEETMLKIPDEPLALDSGSTFQEDGDHLTHENDDDSALQSAREYLTHEHDNMLKDFDPLYCDGDSTLLSVRDLTLCADSTLQVTDHKLALGANSTLQVTDHKLTLGNSALETADAKLAHSCKKYRETSDSFGINTEESAVTDLVKISEGNSSDASKQTIDEQHNRVSSEYDAGQTSGSQNTQKQIFTSQHEDEHCDIPSEHSQRVNLSLTGTENHKYPNQDFTSSPKLLHPEIPSQYPQTVDSSLTDTLPCTPSHVPTESRALPFVDTSQSSYVLPSMYLKNNNYNTSLSPSSSCVSVPFGHVSCSSVPGSLPSQVRLRTSVVSSGHGMPSAASLCGTVASNGQYQPISAHSREHLSTRPSTEPGTSSCIIHHPVPRHFMKSSENLKPKPPSAIPGTGSAFLPISTLQSTHTSLHIPRPLFCSTPAVSFSSSLHNPPLIPPSFSTPLVQPTSSERGYGAVFGDSCFVPRSRPQDCFMIPSYNQEILTELRAAMATIEQLNDNYSALQQEHERLKLSFKEREAELIMEITERVASLTRDIYSAQEVRDAAMMEKGAMLERERIAEADAIFSRVDESDSIDEDGDLVKDAFSSDKRSILDEQGKQLLSKIECLNTENRVNVRTMESLIQERNNAIFKCNLLQSELSQQTMKSQTHLAGDELAAHQDTILKLQEKCDYWKNRVKELEEESINLRIYYSLHKSLSPETSHRNSLETFERTIEKPRESVNLTQRENQWLMDQLRAVTVQRDELTRRMEERARFSSCCHADKEKISRLERKVAVLQKKLFELHGQPRSE